ncbi:hypothetical protein TCON_0786 [Astathelohania contejeani]|uniref:GOLD domain-containing protein n=1 Tax=Astathelohania contejeani TaxID=164912 RepID=A0ABQ7I0W2_9MICR|nr:hypothetical protein TCON_0786 [Thelohania contejeani]
MNLFVYLMSAFCSIRVLTPDSPIVSMKNLSKNTVVLIETTWYTRANEHEPWQQVSDYYNVEITLEIKKNKDWRALMTEGVVVTEYERRGSKNSFFFTSPESSYYSFEISGNVPEMGIYAIELKIFEGRESDPNIVSSVDTQIKELQRHVEQATDYCTYISEVQRMDVEDEETYESIFKSVARIVYCSIILKIVVFVASFYYFNIRIKHFYANKKIIS